MVVNIEPPRKIVLDASFALSYLLPDEENNYVKEVFDDYQKKLVDFVSVDLLPYEVLNGIKSSVMQSRISNTKAKLLIKEFVKLDIIYYRISEKEVLNLALLKRISVYDASYLWLAKSNKIQLLTLDSKLKK